jgi:hypothetical protein
MISPGAGFLFKGEGFYITDYRSDEYKKKKAGEQPAVASPGKSDSSAKAESSASSEPKPDKPEKGEKKEGKKESRKPGKPPAGGDE